jgi:hypothetical protein
MQLPILSIHSQLNFAMSVDTDFSSPKIRFCLAEKRLWPAFYLRHTLSVTEKKGIKGTERANGSGELRRQTRPGQTNRRHGNHNNIDVT